MAEIDEYHYELPPELIAQHPLPCRTDARLLVVRRGRQSLEHCHVRDLPDLLDPRDTLVLNDTKVIPARLVGRRERTGGRWQGLFLGVDPAGIWTVMGKTRGSLQAGERVVLTDLAARDAHHLVMLGRLAEGRCAVRPDPPCEWTELLERVGRVPLPPYIRGGEMQEPDRSTYQTVYASQPGAVAAPTAGLHFTPELLARVDRRGVGTARVTLHVGIGTFRPVTADRLDDHVMHAEWGELTAESSETLMRRRAAGGRIVAIGTTSVRVLETAAASDGSLAPWRGETRLFIRPPYAFRAVDVLLTNFHLPKSTLLVLVRTFGGDSLLRRAYDEAIREEYRFFSYGDAMLILP